MKNIISDTLQCSQDKENATGRTLLTGRKTDQLICFVSPYSLIGRNRSSLISSIGASRGTSSFSSHW